jgi:zinc/manganese transport system substrate-binding protein
VAVALALVAAACGSDQARASASSERGRGTRVQVLAAENFWGSIAAQLGGAHAEVLSVISNPDTDPHDYEPTAADGRNVAEAQLVIENGVGYDPWMARLVAADQVSGQRVLEVGHLLGLAVGDNPHRWYYPGDVDRVVDGVTADLQRLDPADADYFAQRRQRYLTQGLARYHQLLAQIRARYAGTAVGASESVFVGLAQAAGLHLVTPPSYLQAISEGTDPSAADRATVERQLRDHQVAVWVLNRQNATPDIQSLTDLARAEHIPVTTITETLAPAGQSFQGWQVAQLEALAAALARGTGR